MFSLVLSLKIENFQGLPSWRKDISRVLRLFLRKTTKGVSKRIEENELMIRTGRVVEGQNLLARNKTISDSIAKSMKTAITKSILLEVIWISF